MIAPGATVKHVLSHKEHDEHHGIVVEIHDIQTLSGNRVEYWVRWIKPNGDPSDGLTRHAKSELEPV